MHKKIIVLVDNRLAEENLPQVGKSSFRGSAFKATEIDPQENNEIVLQSLDQQAYIAQLQQKITTLEQRISRLEKSSRTLKLRRRIRRKACQINRQFKCQFKGCQKFYGSETSLKNHLKLKHGKKVQQKI